MTGDDTISMLKIVSCLLTKVRMSRLETSGLVEVMRVMTSQTGTHVGWRSIWPIMSQTNPTRRIVVSGIATGHLSIGTREGLEVDRVPTRQPS